MATKSGKIIELLTEPGVSKTTGRGYTIHGVRLEDGTAIEVGFKQPYSVGLYFNRDVEIKYGKLKDVGPAVAGAPEMGSVPSPSRSPSPAATPTGGRTFPVGRESPEMSIIRQNALTNAREVVCGSYAKDLTGMGTKDERRQHLDAVVEDILYVAYKFADFSSGQREVARAAEISKLNPPTV
jgi:hypothetical protein